LRRLRGRGQHLDLNVGNLADGELILDLNADRLLVAVASSACLKEACR